MASARISAIVAGQRQRQQQRQGGGGGGGGASASVANSKPNRQPLSHRDDASDAKPIIKTEPSTVPAAAASARNNKTNTSDNQIQHLSFDGLVVKPDTSEAGVAQAQIQAARKRKRAPKASRSPLESGTKKEIGSAAGSGSRSSEKNVSALSSIYNRSQIDKIKTRKIKNTRERVLIESRKKRDELLIESALSHEILEQKEPGRIITRVAVNQTSSQNPFIIKEEKEQEFEEEYQDNNNNPTLIPFTCVDRSPLSTTWTPPQLETYQLSQSILRENVDLRTERKMFHLDLNGGEYNVDYSRNGRHLLLGGSKGHCALLDWTHYKLLSEIQLGETIRDVQILHNYQMFAVAQEKFTYIYDNTGLELHCLENHFAVNRLTYLPYHFLLVSIGKTGYLRYQDISTGAVISQLRTRKGNCDVMSQISNKGIIVTGHSNGTVSLWSPSISTPLVTILTHSSSLLSTAVDLSGNYLVTSGMDSNIKIWDLRMYKSLNTYYSHRPSTTIDISQNGLLGVGFGPHINIWNNIFTQSGEKQFAPYLTHSFPGQIIRSIQFCPYEDFLGIGTNKGFSTMLVPGSGYSHFDSNEADPFENKKNRRERLVHGLLEKLQPEMISLSENSLVGLMNSDSIAVFEGERQSMREQREKQENDRTANRIKARGGQKSSKRWKRRRVNIIDKASEERRAAIEKRENEKKKAKEKEEKSRQQDDGLVNNALARFQRK